MQLAWRAQRGPACDMASPLSEYLELGCRRLEGIWGTRLYTFVGQICIWFCSCCTCGQPTNEL